MQLCKVACFVPPRPMQKGPEYLDFSPDLAPDFGLRRWPPSSSNFRPTATTFTSFPLKPSAIMADWLLIFLNSAPCAAVCGYILLPPPSFMLEI
ncbi:hypothetical protein BOTBODRAFT_57929 [Botryobasidium botryosum FD-172 SS1]|uniref:Uncharacterized protein n=1 Tax=Botryobasidium botryosum (strain FD-172 SS1) TaxID=930990 RepID=A0A067MFR6_BOTB1|nr:hypothetical protein BOTBODRAFT_57929 [Botryobasidium botryosum FD-172 SS1]